MAAFFFLYQFHRACHVSDFFIIYNSDFKLPNITWHHVGVVCLVDMFSWICRNPCVKMLCVTLLDDEINYDQLFISVTIFSLIFSLYIIDFIQPYSMLSYGIVGFSELHLACIIVPTSNTTVLYITYVGKM